MAVQFKAHATVIQEIQAALSEGLVDQDTGKCLGLSPTFALSNPRQGELEAKLLAVAEFKHACNILLLQSSVPPEDEIACRTCGLVNCNAFPRGWYPLSWVSGFILLSRLCVPRTSVCFDCGNTEFALSETELHQLIARPLEGVYDADAHRPAFRDREHIGDGLSQHPKNFLGFRARFRVEGIYTDISTSRQRRAACPKGNLRNCVKTTIIPRPSSFSA